jgi:ABC-type multidrug transport system ATPase subunit
MTSPAVLIDGLSVAYPNGIVAVDGVSLSVRRGEVFGLLGLNGAGKSSLIKTIATLMRPDAGRVEVFGIDTRRRPADAKRRMGVMSQENNLDTALSVRQNLLFHCRYAGMPPSAACSRAAQWLSALGLEDKAAEPVMRLSGGTKRKIMLAKALMTEPDLLVLDEPTPGLDPGARSWLWQRMRQFRAEGGTIFLSTHYLEEAETLCDRIGILHHGRMTECLAAAPGSLAEAFAQTTGGIG